MVGILILVNKYVLEFILIIASDLVIVLQKLDRPENHIVKIHCVGIFKKLLIAFICFADCFKTYISACLSEILFGSNELILCTAYLLEYSLVREHFIVYFKKSLSLFHNTL